MSLILCLCGTVLFVGTTRLHSAVPVPASWKVLPKAYGIEHGHVHVYIYTQIRGNGVHSRPPDTIPLAHTDLPKQKCAEGCFTLAVNEGLKGEGESHYGDGVVLCNLSLGRGGHPRKKPEWLQQSCMCPHVEPEVNQGAGSCTGSCQ